MYCSNITSNFLVAFATRTSSICQAKLELQVCEKSNEKRKKKGQHKVIIFSND